MERITLKPTTPQLDGRDLPELCDLYLAAIKPRVAESTRGGLITTLDRFKKFWSMHGPTVNYILTPSILDEFGTWLEAQSNRHTNEPLSYCTRHDTLRRLRQCFRWAWRNEYLPSDWGRHVPAARGQAITHNALSLADLRAIFDQCIASSVRDLALFVLYSGTGARRAEVAGLLVSDIKFADSGNSGIVVYRGTKNGTDRQSAFDSMTGRYLKLYMSKHPHLDHYLFPGRDEGKPIGDETVGRIFRRHAQTAGVESFSGCHDFRRSFTTYWILKFGGEISASLLSRQVGHRYPSTVTLTVYNQTTADDIRKCMEIRRLSSFAQMLTA